MKRICMIACVCIQAWCVFAADSLNLGALLLEEGDTHGAAIEFRRAAALNPAGAQRGGYLGAAGYAYLRGRQLELAEQMIDEMEDTYPRLEFEAMLLRGETARQRSDWRNAAFYYGAAERAAGEDGADAAREYVIRQHAGALFRAGDRPAAQMAAEQLPADAAVPVREVLDDYERGRNKRPWLGGLLGLVPGMGYLYSGETANAARSLILNSIFIFAMVDTARNDQWGAFAAVTFFELTWYSGSIYGGIDAAHRYNRRRVNETAHVIEGDGAMRMNAATLPLLSFQIEF